MLLLFAVVLLVLLTICLRKRKHHRKLQEPPKSSCIDSSFPADVEAGQSYKDADATCLESSMAMSVKDAAVASFKHSTSRDTSFQEDVMHDG